MADGLIPFLLDRVSIMVSPFTAPWLPTDLGPREGLLIIRSCCYLMELAASLILSLSASFYWRTCSLMASKSACACCFPSFRQGTPGRRPRWEEGTLLISGGSMKFFYAFAVLIGWRGPCVGGPVAPPLPAATPFDYFNPFWNPPSCSWPAAIKAFTGYFEEWLIGLSWMALVLTRLTYFLSLLAAPGYSFRKSMIESRSSSIFVGFTAIFGVKFREKWWRFVRM